MFSGELKLNIMKIIYWRILVGIVIVVALVSFLFVFHADISSPRLASVPYIFWTSFILTVLLVILTYLGHKLFPFNED